MKNNKKEYDVYKRIKEEAKKRLIGIDEKMLGYEGLLQMEIHKICNEKGIPWEAQKEGILED